METDRIPGFAICAHCSARRRLMPCAACGLLSCADCRGHDECVTCVRERIAALKRAIQKARLGTLARRAAVVGCVALSGAAAAGAALLPAAQLASTSDPRLSIVARNQLGIIGDVVARYSDAHGAACPPSLGALRQEGYLLIAPVDPWGEPLLYGCVDSPRAFVILSKGPDHEIGTGDDLLYSSR